MHAKPYPHRGTRGVMEPLPRVFFLSLWVVALLEAQEVTKHGHHLGRHLGFNQELARLQVKTARIDFFVPDL